VSYRVRVINLKDNQISWKPLKNGYLGIYEVNHPQIALMLAEAVLQMEGDTFLDAQPVSMSGGGEPDVSGILIFGKSLGAVVEGADFIRFDYE
jgi:hypothetical protein